MSARWYPLEASSITGVDHHTVYRVVILEGCFSAIKGNELLSKYRMNASFELPGDTLNLACRGPVANDITGHIVTWALKNHSVPSLKLVVAEALKK